MKQVERDYLKTNPHPNYSLTDEDIKQAYNDMLAEAAMTDARGERCYADRIKGTPVFSMTLIRSLAHAATYYVMGKNPSSAMSFGDTSNLSEDELKRWTALRSFLSHLDFSSFEEEGDTPLDLAMKVMLIFHRFLAQAYGSAIVSRYTSYDESTFGVYMLDEKPEELAELLDRAGSEYMTEAAAKGIPFMRLNQAHIAFVQMLSRVGEVKTLSEKKGKTTRKRAPRSASRRKIKMHDTSEVMRASRVQLAMPDADKRIADKTIQVSQGVRTLKEKQVLYVVEDWSGSMCTTYKEAACSAFVKNRLDHVRVGDAELHFFGYVTSLGEEWVADDKKSAEELWNKHKQIMRNGGGTFLEMVLKEVSDLIHERHADATIKPEVLVIHDGQDRVRAERVDTEGIIVHALILGQNNNGIKEICENSGGEYMLENFKTTELSMLQKKPSS